MRLLIGSWIFQCLDAWILIGTCLLIGTREYIKAEFKRLLLCIDSCTSNCKYVSTILDWLRPKKDVPVYILERVPPSRLFEKRQLCEKSALCAKMPPLDWQSLNNGLRFWPYLVTEGGICKKGHLSERGFAVLTPFFILPFMLMPNISCLSKSNQLFAKVTCCCLLFYLSHFLKATVSLSDTNLS